MSDLLRGGLDEAGLKDGDLNKKLHQSTFNQ